MLLHCYKLVLMLKYIVISTLLDQFICNNVLLQDVTNVTKSLDLSKHLCGFKIYKNIKNNSNEEAYCL
jgi:hypothetical protein